MGKCLPILLCLLAGCSTDIYVRDHVTDGDTFYLAPQAFSSDDPVLQSWVVQMLQLQKAYMQL